ncbi:MAG: PAS domain-containing protein [Acidimicrobiia bacterium]
MTPTLPAGHGLIAALRDSGGRCGTWVPCFGAVCCRYLADAASEGALVHGDGIVLDADQAFIDMFGFAEPADVVGKNVVELIAALGRALDGAACFGCSRRGPAGAAPTTGATGEDTVAR